MGQSVAGFLAASITAWAFWLYIRGILLGETIPNRATWIVWWIEGLFILASSWEGGARWTLAGAAVAQLGYTIVIFLSRKYGAVWTETDKWSVRIAIAGSIALWLVTGNPLLVLLLNLGIDLVGCRPTIIKAYKDPGSEDAKGWLLFATASIASIGAITNWGDVLEVSYPLYIAWINCFIALIVRWPRRKALED